MSAASPICRLFEAPRRTKVRKLDVSPSDDGRAVYRKDILRVGEWIGDGWEWQVTRKTLDQIVHSYTLAVANGAISDACWGHPKDSSAENRIGPILRLSVEPVRQSSGKWVDTLFAEFESTDADDQKKLAKSGQQVSVAVEEPWKDGEGNEYPIHLTHLGFVLNPVVTKQGPLVRLSAKRSSKRVYTMADDNGDMDDGGGAETNLTVKEAIGLFELVSGGRKFPSEISTANELKIAIKAMFQADEPDDTPEELDAMAVEAMNAGQLVASLTHHRKLAKTRGESEREARKERFLAAVNTAAERGALLPDEVEQAKKDGEATDWNEAIVRNLAKLPSKLGGGVVRRALATGQAKASGASQTETEEERKARIKSFGL